MRNILLAIAVAMLPAAAAEPSSTQKVDKLQDSGRLLPLKRTGAGNPCAVMARVLSSSPAPIPA
jgi:hypothetical protein